MTETTNVNNNKEYEQTTITNNNQYCNTACPTQRLRIDNIIKQCNLDDTTLPSTQQIQLQYIFNHDNITKTLI